MAVKQIQVLQLARKKPTSMTLRGHLGSAAVAAHGDEDTDAVNARGDLEAGFVKPQHVNINRLLKYVFYLLGLS